jgi:gamma-glutamyltranspeptidase/glutathione hydrolase
MESSETVNPTPPRRPLLKTFSALSVLGALLALQACSNNDDVITTAAQDTACAQVTDSGSVDVGSGLPGDPAAPEPASGFRSKKLVSAKTYMVVTANPYASKAGCEVLKKGGSAVDAAVAVQAVLGLVEPQSSGLGGGAFMLHYDAKTKKVQSYDGREMAPAAATEDYLRTISATNAAPPLPIPAGTAPESNAAFTPLKQSGRSVGTPGAVRMLDLAHKDYGSLAWKDLFASGVQLATDGFPISGRMAERSRDQKRQLLTDSEAAAYFLNADGSGKALGTVIKNPAYAATLTGPGQQRRQRPVHRPYCPENIVKKIKLTSGGSPSVAITPGLTEMSDLANYQAKKRDPVCTTYRNYWVCGMGPPSSGGMTVASALGTLENFYLAGYKPTAMDTNGGKPTVMGVHLISRSRAPGLCRPQQVHGRHRLRAAARRLARRAAGQGLPAQPGQPDRLHAQHGHGPGGHLHQRAAGHQQRRGQGHHPHDHRRQARQRGGDDHHHRERHGLVPHDQRLPAQQPADRLLGAGARRQQRPIANRVQANKRPRSSMAPTLVFKMADDGSMGDFLMGTGSPGGATIIQYVIKTLVGVLDWGMDAQQATSMINFRRGNGPTTNVGGEHPNVNAATNGGRAAATRWSAACARWVTPSAWGRQSSGTSTIVKATRSGATVLEGGADPRREGIVLGDTFKP